VGDVADVSEVHAAFIFRTDMCRLGLADLEIRIVLDFGKKKHIEYKIKIPHRSEKSLDSRMSGSCSVRRFISIVNSR
jgi:hypothetical protein